MCKNLDGENLVNFWLFINFTKILQCQIFPPYSISSFLEPCFKDSNYFTLEGSIIDEIREQMEEILLLNNPAVIQEEELA